ncbi:hypothetical protein K505DRAFT_372845 [Melanomma pulvis-pyrius CBS 109.77]|uniref:Uncharacterized protein n=1 Tax=Melanomma pulvis-pyrius CBS 109.77 TaxID=1314802 RepID=A0A6A6XK39_9PLEO|nr:hypothetical protein K505DRAFT_372845 [Melanomma pulvis-pyrius CBS 109.77]
MAMLKSFRAGWKRKRSSKKNNSAIADPDNRPIISNPIPKPPPPPINAAPHRINYAQPYRIPYAVPYPVAAEKKNPGVRRRLTVYFKKDTQPAVTVTPILHPNSASPTNSVGPLSPAFSSQSEKSMLSSSSRESTLLKRSSVRVPTRGKSVKMPARPKSLRRASGDLLSVYTFLGGQETISADPKNRRASRFYMDTQYQSLASPTSPAVPSIPSWATAR